MGVRRQQGRPVQRSLFEGLEAGVRPGESGAGGTQAGSFEESQASAASEPARALTDRLMDEV
jgi:RNA-directed DNA polymerase